MPEHTNGPWRVIHPILDGGSLNVVQSRHTVTRQKVIARVEDCSRRADTEANARLISAAPQMAEVLKAYEKWEADVILCDEAWGGGMEPLPTIPQHLWDRLVEIQGMRNAALTKARGEESNE